MNTTPVTTPGSVGKDAPSASSIGFRLGVLFGPGVFGVTAAGVALPDVAADLAAGRSAVVWVLTAYALALGVGTALFGRLSDAWGVRTTLMVGALLAVTGTVVCVAATALWGVVTGRLVLALGAGALGTSALTIAASGAPADRPKVLGTFGATMAFFAASAPLAGGVVTDVLSWRATLVLPVLSLIGVVLVLPVTPARPVRRRAVDLIGAALLTVAVSALVVLIQAPALDGAWEIAVTAALVVLAVAGLAWRIARVPAGFVPRALLNTRYCTAVLVGFGVYGGLFATMYAVPQILVGTHRFTVLGVGLALLPGAVAGAVASRTAGRVAATRAGRYLLAGIALATAVTMALPATVGGGPAVLVVAASLGLAAFAVTQVVMTGAVSAQVPLATRGAAVGLLNLGFFVGGAVGSAVAGTVARSAGLTEALAITAVCPLAGAVLVVTMRDRSR